MVHITHGNSKIGKTANISLPPIQSCIDHAPCAKDCYAVKFYNMWPEVKKAWDDNLREALHDIDYYMACVRRYLLRYCPEYFRWHVGGDIIDQKYLEGIKDIAKDYSYILFAVFTKNYNLSFCDIPPNLSIIFSVWPGLSMPKKPFPKAFVRGYVFIPAGDYIICPGSCEGCRACWNLKELKRNVVLSKH